MNAESDESDESGESSESDEPDESGEPDESDGVIIAARTISVVRVGRPPALTVWPT